MESFCYLCFTVIVGFSNKIKEASAGSSCRQRMLPIKLNSQASVCPRSCWEFDGCECRGEAEVAISKYFWVSISRNFLKKFEKKTISVSKVPAIHCDFVL